MESMPVVVGVDGSEESLRAAEWAAREAQRHRAPLRIVSVPATPLLEVAVGIRDPHETADALDFAFEEAADADSRTAPHIRDSSRSLRW